MERLRRDLRPVFRSAIGMLACTTLLGVSAPTADAADGERGADPGDPRTMRFLRENRTFFRTQLDRLKVVSEERRRSEAIEVDPRYAMFQSMLEEIRAAQETSVQGREETRSRELLEDVEQLSELEAQMRAIDRLLADQGDRLSRLDRNFADQQQTSLVVLLTGLPPAGSPRAVTLREQGSETYRVTLAPPVQEALARGGSVELLHELVEPGRHRYEVTLEGPQWASAPAGEVVIELEADRLTFLELDLAEVDPETPQGFGARTWVR